MGWSYVGAGTASGELTSTASGVSVALPAGIQDGDLLILSLVSTDVDEQTGALVWDQTYTHAVDYAAYYYMRVMKYKIYYTGMPQPTVSNSGLGADGKDCGFAQIFAFRHSIGSLLDEAISLRAGVSTSVDTGGYTEDATLTGFTPRTPEQLFIMSCVRIGGDCTAIAAITAGGGEPTWTEIQENRTNTGYGYNVSVQYAIDSGTTTVANKTLDFTGGGGYWNGNFFGLYAARRPQLVQPTYVGASTPNTATGTVNLPSGLQDGDVLLFYFVNGDDDDGASLAAGSSIEPSGWTYYGIHDSTNPARTWTANSSPAFAQVFAFRNCYPGSYYDGGSSFGSAGGSAQDIGPITTIAGIESKLQDGTGVIVIAGTKQDDCTSVATLSGDGLTWVEAAENISSAGSGLTFVVNYTIPTKGGTPTLTNKTFSVTGGASAAWDAVTWVLFPAYAGYINDKPNAVVVAGTVSAVTRDGSVTPGFPSGTANYGDALYVVCGGSVASGGWNAPTGYSQYTNINTSGAAVGIFSKQWASGDTAPSMSLASGAATDAWWCQMLRLSKHTDYDQETGLLRLIEADFDASGTGSSTSAQSPVMGWSGMGYKAKGTILYVLAKADDSSSIASPSTTPSVHSFTRHAYASDTAQNDATFLVETSANLSGLIDDYGSPTTVPGQYVISGGAAAAIRMYRISLHSGYMQGAEFSGSFVASSGVAGDQAITADLDGTVAADSTVNATRVFLADIDGSVTAISGESAAIQSIVTTPPYTKTGATWIEVDPSGFITINGDNSLTSNTASWTKGCYSTEEGYHDIEVEYVLTDPQLYVMFGLSNNTNMISTSVDHAIYFYPVTQSALFYNNDTYLGQTGAATVKVGDRLGVRRRGAQCEWYVNNTVLWTATATTGPLHLHALLYLGTLSAPTIKRGTWVFGDSTISSDKWIQFHLGGTIPCVSGVDAHQAFGWSAAGQTDCYSDVNVVAGGPKIPPVSGIDCVAGLSHTFKSYLQNLFRSSKEWGSEGGGGRRPLVKDKVKVLLNRKR